jgi:predicted O-linked N-acetylglucosamine transferase (SPINDLY family)
MITMQALLENAQRAMAEGRWADSSQHFGLAAQRNPTNANVWHNLGVSLLALGKAQLALNACNCAFSLNPELWQSRLIQGKAQKMLGQVVAADKCFADVLKIDPANGTARIARADLAMNTFGAPLKAMEWVKPLLGTTEHGEDAELTTLMASLYDRDESAQVLNKRIIKFSRTALRLDASLLAPRPTGAATRSGRSRVGLLSPLFCVSPVYFLTISGWRHLAKTCDVVVFNRGHKTDWATQVFKDLANEWHNVQEMDALRLAQAMQAADIDVLYDLGGWMDPVGLKALSVKPAKKMFKWVGGQSVTTGLETFDGWIGDEGQSPLHLQHLYTEPLVNVQGGYATYTPPDYLPPIPKQKSDVPVVFSNPAKVSRAFLAHLQTIPGKKRFVHQQFQYAQARLRVEEALGHTNVEFVLPANHREALEVLGRHKVMLDTFPYSSGLTAREAQAMGVRVEAKVGTLFCERHCANLVS